MDDWATSDLYAGDLYAGDLYAGGNWLLAQSNDDEYRQETVTVTGTKPPSSDYTVYVNYFWEDVLPSDIFGYDEFIGGGGGGGAAGEDEDDTCGNHVDYPDGVSPEALNQKALEALQIITAAVGDRNQEGFIGIFQTSSGQLVLGNLLLSAVAPSGEIAGLKPPPSYTLLGPGTLVATVHNHPGGIPFPSTADEAWFSLHDDFNYGGKVSEDLVSYISGNAFVSTPDGAFTVQSLYAHTKEGTAPVESAKINADGSSSCSA
jgi:hypothetical protein